MKKVLVALVIASALSASDPWSSMDRVRQAALTTSLVIDWGQTNCISDAGIYEQNPLLGRHPSKTTIAGYFVASILNAYLVSDLLPAEWRKVYQIAFLSFQAFVVGHNYRIGLKVVF